MSDQLEPNYVIGNWKLNPNAIMDALTLAAGIDDVPGCVVGITPTIAHFYAVQSAKKDTISIGVQDITHLTNAVGAYTGEISASVALDLGADFVIIGHSERRQYYGESEEQLSRKIHHALSSGLSVIYCIGETKAEYEAGSTLEILQNQLAVLALFRQLLDAQKSVTSRLPSLVIAYEPVWAIGTGLTPTLAEVEAAHRFIRETLAVLGMTPPILYGGSVNADNASMFAQSAWVDGALVGGASLKVESFLAIAQSFAKTKG